MWWRDHRAAARAARFAAVRLGVIVCAASLLAGCFQPLYGSHPSVGGDSVKDKLAEVQIAPIPTRQGTPQARLAVGVHNALQFDLTGGAGTNAPTHRLDLTVSAGRLYRDRRSVQRPPDGASRRRPGDLSARGNRHRQNRVARYHIRQCRLRRARLGTALRRTARAARCRRPRRADGRRHDPQPAGVVFRRRD